MKIEINLENKSTKLIASAIILLAVIGVATAYVVGPGATPNPGHALTTIQGYFTGDTTLQDSLGKFQQRSATGITCTSTQYMTGVNANGTASCGDLSGTNTGKVVGGGGEAMKDNITFGCSTRVPAWGAAQCVDAVNDYISCNLGTKQLIAMDGAGGAGTHKFYICVIGS